MNVHMLANFLRKKGVLMIMHVIILVLSAWLVVMISIDTFNDVSFYEEPQFQKYQFWICVVFLFDFFLEFALSDRKWHYIWTHLIFFIVAIPYQAVIYHFGWHMSKEFSYIVRYIPLIRGGYAMAIVVSWFTYNKATGLFFTYIITLFSTVYFASLIFYQFEFGTNPLVKAYKDALWWATMDVTTVGCNIIAVTTVGRVLSVMLAALGMMMFPIFTVYVTNLITQRNKEAGTHEDEISIVKAYRNFVKAHPDKAEQLSEATSGKDVPKQ